jgi:23S rRNA-/tRNA-specific pseudouridylate synthase
VDTEIEKLYYDELSNTTTLLVTISKWIRHQIRAHLSSIWYPIVWEKIYIKNKSVEKLHLFSMWMKVIL